MTLERFDVTILGGGLAGLSTAAALAANTRLSIAVVEMRIRWKPTARAVYNDSVEKFGLQAAVLRAYTRMEYRSAYGSAASFDYGEQNSLSALDLSHACRILLQRSLGCGVQLRQARAVGLIHNQPMEPRPLRLLLAGGDEIETQILVDASGPAQWTARQLGVPRSKYASLCYGERLLGCQIDKPETFAFLAPHQRYGNGGGWFYPLQDDTASFGYSIVVPNVGNARSRTNAWRYQAAKREFQPYARQVQAAFVDSIEGGAVPVGRVGRFCDDRILRVGDAGGQANPWSVEGCRPALENGLLAARVIQKAFHTRHFDRTTLAAFEEAWEKDNRERFWRTESAAHVVWNRPDAAWEQFIHWYARLPGERQYQQLRENRSGVLGQIYARLGYARRQLAKKLRANK